MIRKKDHMIICKSDNFPLPEFEVNPEDIMVMFSAPADRVDASLGRVTDGVTERVTEKVTEKELEVLSVILEDPAFTYGQIAEKLSISRKTVSTRIKSLKEKGIIKRIGSDTKGHWEICEK